MTHELIPNDAPFDGERRRFAEGFMAGLLAVRNAHQAAVPAADNPDATPLLILYGSQSGNGEALSKDLRKLGRASGFKPTVSDLDSFDRGQLAETRLLLIVCSTFGEGDPPDNAKQFTDWILSEDAPELSDLNFAVCALGDRLYTHFCKAGIDLDNRLAELGASRLADCVECDVDYEDDYAAWKQDVFGSEVMIESASDTAVVLEDETESDSGTAKAWGKSNPFPATLLHCACLNGEGSSKEVNHVELSLAGSGMDYVVGDALGLVPINCPELVDDVLRRAALPGDAVIQFKGTAYTLREALLRLLDLNTMTPKAFETLQVDPPADADCVCHLIDLLEQTELELTAELMVGALRPLQPRLYSIASSPNAHPGQVHLTVGAVRYAAADCDRKGVASTFLADRLPVGATVGVYVQKAAHFHLPEDPATPIIMVGPGTGIAPFRAFLEEREASEATGDNWLFFGDQHEACDFLYRDQLQAMLERGVLNRLDLAWSRDQGEKVYVQNRMLEQGETMWSWLQNGTHFYVCGDATRMAVDVEKALLTIARNHGGLDDEQAAAWITELSSQGRYQRDVY